MSGDVTSCPSNEGKYLIQADGPVWQTLYEIHDFIMGYRWVLPQPTVVRHAVQHNLLFCQDQSFHH